jgi:hypothetical protein
MSFFDVYFTHKNNNIAELKHCTALKREREIDIEIPTPQRSHQLTFSGTF